MIAVSPIATIFNPIVGEDNGFIDLNYTAGIMASKPLMAFSSFQDTDAFQAQIFLRVQDIIQFIPVNGRGVAAPSCLRNQVRVGYVDTGGLLFDGLIGRVEIENILGKSAQTNVQEHTLEIGVAGILLDDSTDFLPRPVVDVYEIGD